MMETKENSKWNCKCFDIIAPEIKNRYGIEIDTNTILLTADLKLKTRSALYAKGTNKKGQTVYHQLIANYCPFCGAKVKE